MKWNNLELPDKPYYQDDAVVIYHADCRDILPLIPDKSIDLVLTDLPYANNTDYGIYLDTKENLCGLIDTAFPQIKRVGNLVGITTGIGNMFDYPKPDWCLCWYIGQNGQLSTQWGFNCWQPILVWGKDPYLARGLGRRADAIKHEPEKPDNYRHPCSKPVKTWSKLVMRLSPEANQLILDPFLGSGTTAYCAKKLGRKCIGIEIEEKYCEIAAKRCSQTVMRLEV
jgi:site-specific DNA-methyltransferase (adenine-specific)